MSFPLFPALLAVCFGLFASTASGQAPDPTDTGPRTLMISYRCEPAQRPAFRRYLETKAMRDLEGWQAEGVFASHRLFFNWYVDDGTWDAMLVLEFQDWPDVARWNRIERDRPGGLCAEGLALARPQTTVSADVFWQSRDTRPGTSHSDSVYLLIPYRYLVLVSEYRDYVDGYVIPQLDGWLEHDVLRSYQVLLNRFPTGDRWGSMLLLEYRDLESFGKRKLTKMKVRETLREQAVWKGWSDIKKTLRQELEPIIAHRLERPAGTPASVERTGAAPELAPPPPPTKEFAIVDDRPRLGGQPIELWGLRCGNALCSQAVTERHVRALDTMVAHGINLIGVYLQGSNGGWPDPAAGLNGFDRHGRLNPAVARRLEWLVREADARDMVVMVGLFSPRKDQDFEDEAAVRRATEEAGRFLVARGLRNVFVDLMHEYSHSRIDMDLFREPNGAEKKARLHEWFHGVAPEIEAGVCPYVSSDTADHYPGMQVRIIQKHMPIPSSGFVVNVETQKQDVYENDGVFTPEAKEYIYADCRRYHAEPRAAMLLHAAYLQGIGNRSGTAPHPEMGGYGTGVGDRGIRFYFEWVRDHVGRWQYPRHVPPVPAAEAPSRPTKEFEVRDGRPFLGGAPVRLWGLRCHNALLSDAVTERLLNHLPQMAAHGINLIGVSLQGTNAGFPDPECGANAYAPSGGLIPKYAARLERLVRAADELGMTVCITLLMPRKDQILRDEKAVRRALEETARFLRTRGLRNVFANLYMEFDHPLRCDHEVFAEPDGDAKKERVSGWFRALAPDVELGICPNHTSGSRSEYPGAQVLFFHERMPIPSSGFAVNIETADRDLAGNEGYFNDFAIASLEREWTEYLERPHAALLFRSPFVESVRGILGSAPHFAIGGSGRSRGDRGIRPYYDWLRAHVGRWEYPRHVRD